jgi:hypothetical protein
MSMRARRWVIFAGSIGLLLGLAVGGTADATPIGPPPLTCANSTCQGSIYELTYSGSPISSTATTQTFEVTLTIDPTNYNGGGAFIDNVAPKVSNSVTAALLVSAPTATSDWTLFMTGINAGGCSMAGGGFVCAADSNPPADLPDEAPLPHAGVYSWVFDLTIPTGTLLTAPNAATIKVRYTDSAGTKVGALVSEPITLEIIPEPSTLALVFAGLALLTRRKPIA